MNPTLSRKQAGASIDDQKAATLRVRINICIRRVQVFAAATINVDEANRHRLLLAAILMKASDAATPWAKIESRPSGERVAAGRKGLEGGSGEDGGR